MSTITIYDTKLSPELNAQVDNIQDYLNTLQSYVTNIDVQYQKIELDMNLKIVLDQEYQTKRIGNYLDLYQDNKHFYFFIMGASWGAKMTVNLQLSLDTINTFKGDFHFTNRTHVIREHKSRYDNTNRFTVGTNVLHEKIDNIDEGISGAVQYKSSDETLYSGNEYINQKWYLVYENLNAEGSEGVKCTLYPEKKVPFSASVTNKIYATDLARNMDYYITGNSFPNSGIFFINNDGVAVGYQNGQYYNGRRVLCILYRVMDVNIHRLRITLLLEDGVREPEWVDVDTTGVDKPITPVGAEGYYFANSSERSSSIAVIESKEYHTYSTVIEMTEFENIDWVDRTSSKILKIIECPYCPAELTWDDDLRIHLPEGWVYGTSTDEHGNQHYFIIPNVTTEFGCRVRDYIDLGLTKEVVLDSTTINTVWNWDRYLLDPKLKHSAFSTYKVSYDNFSKIIYPERITHRASNPLSPSINIDYKQSNCISSTLGFNITYNNCTYKEDSDYGSYIISTRGLESPIYNNAFINYIRNGYNYDKKAQQTQKTVSTVGAIVSIVGGIATTALGASSGGISAVAGISLLTTGITTLANTISSNVQAERNIAQKVDEAQNQTASIIACDDLNLLNWYNGNKVHIMQYQVSDNLKRLLDDTFYYCGYASDRYGYPTGRERLWFDYLQCEPVFDEERTSTYQEFVKDIKARYSAGVTVFHKVNNAWDIEQTKENWEYSLVRNLL